jgi:DNA topoisomerase VI subunit A
VFITNLVIIIVTNADPFGNSDYIYYMNQGGKHLSKCKEEMHVSGINIYITLA